MSYEEYLSANKTLAPEGDITVINTTNLSQSEFDLSDTDFLGAAVAAGKFWEIISSVDTWIKFSVDGSTNLDNTARSTATLSGGAGQGLFLPANTYKTFTFDYASGGAIKSVLHTQNVAATGFVVISRASKERV